MRRYFYALFCVCICVYGQAFKMYKIKFVKIYIL